MLANAVAEGSRTVAVALVEGGGGAAFFCCCVQSAISLMKWPITREKPPGMAVLGSVGMDAVAPGSSGWIPYNFHK